MNFPIPQNKADTALLLAIMFEAERNARKRQPINLYTPDDTPVKQMLLMEENINWVWFYEVNVYDDNSIEITNEYRRHKKNLEADDYYGTFASIYDNEVIINNKTYTRI